MHVRSVISRGTAFALLLTLSVVACSADTAPQLDVTTARALWAASGPASYTITVFRSCECLPEMYGAVTVEVRNGIVVSRHYVASGAEVPTQYADVFPSVDGLFALLDEAALDGPSFAAQFDPAFGYPTHLVLADPGADGPEYTVSNFRAQ